MPLDAPSLVVTDAAAWRQWLLQNGANSKGVWLSMARKGATKPTSLTPDQALEEALCFGWINGQGRKGDDATSCQLWTPRRPKSVWSKRNVGFVERLEKEGRVQEAGRRAVEAAKADGRWEAAYSGSATDGDMADFLEAVRENPVALDAWNGLNKSNRSAIYFRLVMLKTPAGRQKRIKAFVEMLVRGDTIIPQKKPSNRIEKSSAKAPERQSAGSTQPARRTRSGRAVPSYKEKD